MSASIDLAYIYRDLHSHPELSLQEERTAGIVARHLAELGYEVKEGVGGTGVVGVLHNGDGATALLTWTHCPSRKRPAFLTPAPCEDRS
jgi:metal-dependent amidase/aminoacylase/carboxypeptidase family protein